MASFNFETNVPIGNEGDSSADTVATFREALKLATAGAVDVQPLSVPPLDGGTPPKPQIAYARVRVSTDDLKYAYGLGVDNDPNSLTLPYSLPGSILLYTHGLGMECPEWVSWFFKGAPGLGQKLDDAGVGGGPYAGLDTGMAIVDKLLQDWDALAPVFLPILTRSAEGAGWFKERVTLKKFEDGEWSNHTPIKLRQFGEGQRAMNLAFPNVTTPLAETGVSPLDSFLSGYWNGGEYNEPFGDAGASLPNVAGSGVNSLFPNWPSSAGSIITVAPHYYMSSWHTPARVRNAWINRAYWDGLSPDDKNRHIYAAMASCLQNIAISYQGQDLIVKQFQTLGATVYQHLPRPVVQRLREGFTDAQDQLAAEAELGDAGKSPPLPASSAYTALVKHQRLWIQENHIRHGAETEDRKFRYQRNKYWPILTPTYL